MQGIISIDVGGSSMRGLLFDFHGNKRKSTQLHYAATFSEPGTSEQDAHIWRQCLEDILRTLASFENYKIACIALTSARSSVIPVDAEGVPLAAAMMWQDRRSAAIVDAHQDAHTQIYKKTGMRFTPVASAPKILWIKQHKPSLYKRTRYFLGIQDFLIHALTGKFVTDHSFGSRTAIMDLQKKCWDEELLKHYGIEEEKLCHLISPGSICGTLQDSFALRVGIPSGIPIVTAGGDQQCAVLGQGIFTSQDLLVNTGTGAYLVQGLDAPIFDTSQRFICNASAIPGKYIFEASVLTAGAIYRWASGLFSFDKGHDPYAHMNAEAAKSPAGAQGVVLLPWFEGRGAPSWNPQSSGAFLNLSLGTSVGDMLRAVLEGIALELAENKASMEMLAGIATEVKSVGGMAPFPLYNQILADCFDAKILCPDESESSSVGAWIAATRALGIHSEYEAAYRLHCRQAQVYHADSRRHHLYMKLLQLRKNIYQGMQKNNFFRE